MDFPLIDKASIPHHHNSHHSGKTIYWTSTDSLERFQDHCQDINKKAILTDLGFSETSITYKYNSYGFRDEEFDHRPCGMAFGCSLTEGVGVPVKDTWPRVLSELTGTYVWNFGVGGYSLDAVFRLLDFWLPYFTPEFVAVCIPDPSRLEVFDSKYPMPLSSHWIGPDFVKNFYKVWISSDNNMNIARRKNLLAIEKLCDDRNIQLITLDNSDIFHSAGSSARDLVHPGADGHRQFANKIKEKL